LEAYATYVNQLAPLVIGPVAAQKWNDVVIAIGGTVSLTYRNKMDKLFSDLNNAGVYKSMADFWMMHCENVQQASVSCVQGVVATQVNSPVFTANGFMKYDGVANYTNTNFNIQTQGVAAGMLYNKCRISVREMVDLGGNNSCCGASDGSSRALSCRPHSSTNQTSVLINGGTLSFTIPNNSSATLITGNRIDDTGIFIAYQDGTNLTVIGGPTTIGNALPANPMYFGCNNNIGSPNSFRASSLGYIGITAPFTASQEGAVAPIINTFVTTTLTMEAMDMDEIEDDPNPELILLLPDQAERVAGESKVSSIYAIIPVPLTDGSFIISGNVLDDLAHEEHHAYLKNCQRVLLSDIKDKLSPDTSE
jgi:hypothetical protein